jgi:hypothetical protein
MEPFQMIIAAEKFTTDSSAASEKSVATTDDKVVDYSVAKIK